MSAPVVAGAVADLLQKRPALTPNQVKAIVMQTARPTKNGFDEVSAMAHGALPRHPAPANQGLTPNTVVNAQDRRDRLHALALEPLPLVHGRRNPAVALVPLELELQLLPLEHRLDRPGPVAVEPQLAGPTAWDK